MVLKRDMGNLNVWMVLRCSPHTPTKFLWEYINPLSEVLVDKDIYLFYLLFLNTHSYSAHDQKNDENHVAFCQYCKKSLRHKTESAVNKKNTDDS